MTRPLVLGPLALALSLGIFAACDTPASAPSASASAKPTAAPTPPPAMTTSAPATAAPTTSASSKPLAPNGIDVPTLGLALEPPATVTGKAQPAAGDVIVRFPGYEVALTLSNAHGDMAYAKKRTAGEPGFVRWDYEKDDVAIAEIEVDKVKEYMGFTVKKLGDASFECGTLTMKRRTSPNEKAVKDALALCEGLRTR